MTVWHVKHGVEYWREFVVVAHSAAQALELAMEGRDWDSGEGYSVTAIDVTKAHVAVEIER